jgi:hypothetical protein
VLSSHLRAKHLWERGRSAEAVATLDEAIGGDRTPAIYLPDGLRSGAGTMPFETVLVRLLASDQDLLVPFDGAVSRLWADLPSQILVSALDARQSEVGDLGEASLAIVYEAAADGLLSSEVADYGLVARIVVRREDHPHLAERLDWSRLDRLTQAALAGDAWLGWVRAHPDLTTNLFLNAVFHRVPVMDRSMRLDGLERIATSQPDVLDEVADTLASWSDHEDVVRVGMALERAAPECALALADAVRARAFDGFAQRCLLN